MSDIVLFDAPGPVARARHRLLAAVGAVLVLAFLAFALYKLGEKGNLAADKWTPFFTASMWVDYLLPGLVNTLKAAAISVVLAGAFGLLFGIGRMSQIAPVRWLCTGVIELFRSIPVLVMMIAAFQYFTYNNVFVSDISPLAAVVTGLTLYNGSVIAELLRSGVSSLPSGQREAGLSIGLTPWQTLQRIQLPQAITAMLPALVGQLVVVLKDTALGNIVLYPELLTNYQRIGSNWSNIVPAMIVIAVIYIGINYTLTVIAGRVEQRMRRSHGGGGGAVTGGAAGPPSLAVETAVLEADEPRLGAR
ncbi:amino acid ABC transporter permease [Dermatophilaceae bacterium Soc4.6]